jgi:hypothetical protein
MLEKVLTEYIRTGIAKRLLVNYLYGCHKFIFKKNSTQTNLKIGHSPTNALFIKLGRF